MSKIRVMVKTKWQRELEKDIRNFTLGMKRKERRKKHPHKQKSIIIKEKKAEREIEMWNKQFKEIMLDDRR